MGAQDNQIITCSATATPNLEALTLNSSTPCIAANTDLRMGPVVLEVPASDAEGTLYGQVVDSICLAGLEWIAIGVTQSINRHCEG